MQRYQGEPGQEVEYGAGDGTIRRIHANADGILTARTDEDAGVLERFGLQKLEEPKAEPVRDAEKPAKAGGKE